MLIFSFIGGIVVLFKLVDTQGKERNLLPKDHQVIR